MATLVGTQTSLTGLLAALIELDMNAVEAYRTALHRLKSHVHRQWLSGFLEDHERHIQELSCLLEKAHGDPPNKPDVMQYVAKGKVVLADVMGTDYDILVAMRANEDDTSRAYGRAVKHAEVSGHLLAVLERNLQDERRHRAWIEERLTYLETQQEREAATQRPPPDVRIY